MRGAGARWGAVEQLFEAQCRKLGLDHGHYDPRREEHAEPDLPRQMTLFGG
jgi:hypothetical protein